MVRPNYPGPSGPRTPQGGKPFYGHQKDDEISDIEGQIKKCKNLSEISVEEIAKEDGIAEKLAKNFRGELKTTQLRKFFDSIVTNQENLKTKGWKSIESDFFMIRPNLAYAKGRKLIPDQFYRIVTLCLDRVSPEGSPEEQKKENYARFVELLKALVAYSKYYEGTRGR